jgi:hypothetical protein
LATAIRPTRADRDHTIDRLREGVGAGLLTAEEFEERLTAAYLVLSVQELHDLVVGLPMPSRRKEVGTARRKWTLLGASVLVVCILIAVAAALTARASSTHPGAAPPPAPFSPPPTAAAPESLAVSILPAGRFAPYDPADECGIFTTTGSASGPSCDVVVELTNTSSLPVTLVPADLHMVDQNGTTSTIGPVAGSCDNTVDIAAPTRLAPKARLAVQLCYPVTPGALPASLVGTQTLDGLAVAVPSGAVSGEWNGS